MDDDGARVARDRFFCASSSYGERAMLRAQAPLEGREGGDACYSCNSYIEHQPCTGARHCSFCSSRCSLVSNGFFSSAHSLAAAASDARRVVWDDGLACKPKASAARAHPAPQHRRVVHPTAPSAVDESAGLRDGWLSERFGRGWSHSSATCQNTVAAAIHVRTHRSRHALLTVNTKMAKLLVLAACTSALLQQPARRISLTPRMGVVKPCVEIIQ